LRIPSLTESERTRIREALSQRLQELRAEPGQITEIARLLSLSGMTREEDFTPKFGDLLAGEYGPREPDQLSRVQAADLITRLARVVGELPEGELVLPTVQPPEVFARRMREVRRRRGWSQQQLAQRLSELGRPMDQTTVHRIESEGTRSLNVSLADVLAIAAALSVSPVYLALPTDDLTSVAITPKTTIDARRAREWFSGTGTLRDDDDRGIWLAERDERSVQALAGQFDREEQWRLERDRRRAEDLARKRNREARLRAELAEMDAEIKALQAEGAEAPASLLRQRKWREKSLVESEAMSLDSWLAREERLYEKGLGFREEEDEEKEE
jgi:transcriptional regulator with XRE-family HTH domain